MGTAMDAAASVAAPVPATSVAALATTLGTAPAAAVVDVELMKSMAGVRLLLDYTRLRAYESAFEAMGFDDALFICGLEGRPDDLTSMCDTVGMKIGHTWKLRSMLPGFIAEYGISQL